MNGLTEGLIPGFNQHHEFSLQFRQIRRRLTRQWTLSVDWMHHCPCKRKQHDLVALEPQNFEFAPR